MCLVKEVVGIKKTESNLRKAEKEENFECICILLNSFHMRKHTSMFPQLWPCLTF